MSVRQKSFIEKAVDNIEQCISLFKNDTEIDIVVSLLRGCLGSLEGILGSVENDEIINNIFKNFCIGK